MEFDSPTSAFDGLSSEWVPFHPPLLDKLACGYLSAHFRTPRMGFPNHHSLCILTITAKSVRLGCLARY